jgi:hypothetical protein
MRHPFDGIVPQDKAPLDLAQASTDRSRRSFFHAAVAMLAGAAGVLRAGQLQAQSGRGELRSQRPVGGPPGRSDLGGPGRSEFGRSRGGPDRVTTLALGEEGGPGRDEFRSNRPGTPPGRLR